MNISHSWLTEYVQPGLAPAELADVLTMLGLEVDEVVQMGPALDGVVVGHVLDARQHPNADRLRVCVVDLGAEHNVEGEPVQIVCGAPNVAAGQYVPVATVGTTLMLPSRENPAEHVPVKIKKSKLRGEVSRGMICAEDELGLSEDHAGIMVLDGEPAPGTAFTDYLAAHNASSNDSIYDIALTPNRPDATSHFGVARDVAAVLDVELSKPAVELPTVGGAAAERISVQIEDPAGCPRYTAMVIDGVTIGPSPQWLQDRLTAIGLRPINNVVDVTNFVMHEIGQPLHAFDAAELSGNTIIIRAAEADEPFTTLDEKERTLPAGTVLICDAERPVAVGGVMGGLNSEVTDSTKTVVLESAYFDPSRIRRASKALALQTDASYRFERGVDPNGAAWAAARAAALIAEVAGGTVVDGIVDVYPEPIEPLTLTLRPARIKRIFGVDVPADEAAAYLNRLGIDTDTEDTDTEDTDTEDTETEAGGVLTCRVPTFRPDIEREIDLIEEVARMYGYDNLPRPAGLYVPYQPPQRDPVESLRSEVLTTLAGLGFRETYSNSLLPKSTAEQFANGESVVETLNPISQDMAAMRPSLLPGLLQAAGHNANHGQSAVRFAELGHVFRKAKPGEDTLVQGYHETEHLIIGMAGHAVSSSWNGDARTADWYDLAGVLASLGERFGLADLRVQSTDDRPDYLDMAGDVLAGSARLGRIGQVAPSVSDTYDAPAPFVYAELDWPLFTQLAASRPAYASIDRFPSVERDLALVIDARQPAGDLAHTARQASGLLQDVTVFDVYEGDPLPGGKKSVALRLTFGGAGRTLVDAQVDGQVKRVLKRLRREYDAELRG